MAATDGARTRLRLALRLLAGLAMTTAGATDVDASPILIAGVFGQIASSQSVGESCGGSGTNPNGCSVQDGFFVTIHDEAVRVAMSASAVASADYGMLKAQVDVSAFFGENAGANFARAEAIADASMRDDFTIAGITDGYLLFIWNVDGSFSGGSSDSGFATAGGALVSLFDGTSYGLPLPNQTLPILIPFSSGGVSAGFRLVASASCIDGNGGLCVATADFGHTATLAGLTVLDLAGNPVLGATFTAASGTIYPSPVASAVPEPATVSLLGLGLAAALARRRRLRERGRDSSAAGDAFALRS